MTATTKKNAYEQWPCWLGLAQRLVFYWPIEPLPTDTPLSLARYWLQEAAFAGVLPRRSAARLCLSLEVNPKARLALSKAFDVALEHAGRQR